MHILCISIFIILLLFPLNQTPPPLGEKIGLVFFSILELVVFTVKSYNQNQNKHSITATPSVIAHLDRNHAVFPVSVIIGLGSMQ